MPGAGRLACCWPLPPTRSGRGRQLLGANGGLWPARAATYDRKSTKFMTRIFLTLALLSNCTLTTALILGLGIGDPHRFDARIQHAVGVHFIVGVAALVFAVMVHALVLTYFMGTGRWLEETAQAYRLPGDSSGANRNLKWKVLPAMLLSLILLISTGAFGAAADPASSVGFQGLAGLSAATVHWLVAGVTLAVNLAVNALEFVALSRNKALIDAVLAEVRRIRVERGLPV